MSPKETLRDMSTTKQSTHQLSIVDQDVTRASTSPSNNDTVSPPPSDWTPSSWRTKPQSQPVTYPNPTHLSHALKTLTALPPLVTPPEIHRLKTHLRAVALGHSFLLQGGDCAELFTYCTAPTIDAKIKLLLQMSLVLVSALGKPIVRVARMAGQYAKPRSSATETLSDRRTVPSFRGDILNGYGVEERDLDPGRLVQAYFHSAATLNHIRGQLASGIADLHRPLDWGLGHVRDEKLQARYQRIVDRVTDSLRFLRTVGADPSGVGLSTVELFTSHEGLLLEYEEGLTRRLPRPEYDGHGDGHAKSHTNGSTGSNDDYDDDNTDPATAYYNTSAHFLWIGDRTRSVTGAHVEFFRGLANPIGVKVGPSMTTPELTQLLHILDPRLETGKITLITRYGASKIRSLLPAHIAAVRASNHTVVWQCDPMHGNTTTLASGVKTRHLPTILAELIACIGIHRELGSVLGGVHLELTGDPVTECTGGGEELGAEDLKRRYMTYCDPRLNERQALEVAFAIAGEYGEGVGDAGGEEGVDGRSS